MKKDFSLVEIRDNTELLGIIIDKEFPNNANVLLFRFFNAWSSRKEISLVEIRSNAKRNYSELLTTRMDGA